MTEITNEKLSDAVFKFDNYKPDALVQYLTCENFEEEYHTYMYTNGLYYYNYYLSLIFINEL